MDYDPYSSLDGETIREILQGIVDSITAVLLLILVEIFKIFLVFVQDLIAGHFIANPAVILIALMIFFTAYMIWRR